MWLNVEITNTCNADLCLTLVDVLKGSPLGPFHLCSWSSKRILSWISWVHWLPCYRASLEVWCPITVLLLPFERLLIWTYFHLFPHITCRCLFPHTVRSFFTGLFIWSGLCCIWSHSTDALFSHESRGYTEKGFVWLGNEGEGGSVLLGRNTCLWSPNEPLG